MGLICLSIWTEIFSRAQHNETKKLMFLIFMHLCHFPCHLPLVICEQAFCNSWFSGFHRHGKLLSISDVSLWVVRPFWKGWDECWLLFGLHHLMPCSLLVGVCGLFPFVYLFFPNVIMILCWVMTLILHSFISHIYDEGNILVLEHICWLFVEPYSNEKQKTMNGWWECFVWRSQRDLPCYPLLPFVHGVGLG